MCGEGAAVLAPLDGAALVTLLGEALQARLATDVDDLLGGHHICKEGKIEPMTMRAGNLNVKLSKNPLINLNRLIHSREVSETLRVLTTYYEILKRRAI